MLRTIVMECSVVNSNRVIYKIDDHAISIDKAIADEYAEMVCPISDNYLTAMITAFGKKCTDNILSREIELDMARELEEYAY